MCDTCDRYTKAYHKQIKKHPNLTVILVIPCKGKK